MRLPKYIWIKNKRYYLWDTFTTYEQARRVAEAKKKVSKKNKWFIMTHEAGGITGTIYAHNNYSLYMTHVIKIDTI